MIRTPNRHSEKTKNRIEQEDAKRLFEVDIKNWLESISTENARNLIFSVLRSLQDEAEITAEDNFPIPWERFSIAQDEVKKTLINLWSEGLFELENKPARFSIPEAQDKPILYINGELDRRMPHDLFIINQEIKQLGGWNSLWINLRPIRLSGLDLVVSVFNDKLSKKPELRFRNGILEYGQLQKSFNRDDYKVFFTSIWKATSGKKSSTSQIDLIKREVESKTRKLWSDEDMEKAIQHFQRSFGNFPLKISKKGNRIILAIID